MGKFSLLFFLSFATYSVHYSDAICCPWTVTSDVKCQCDDGGLVHPWECCSVGACNVFCCNCGGPCRNNSSEEIAYNQWFSEALEHLGKSENGIFQQIKNLFTPIWFSKMDTNQDGIISPNEFDRDLDENIMKQFHNMRY